MSCRQLGLLFLVFLFCCCNAEYAHGQIRVVTYNTANATGIEGNTAIPRTGMEVVLEAIGDESTGGIAKPIDILALQEQDDIATTTQIFVNMLNAIYGPGTYARGYVLNDVTAKLHTGIVYNTNTVTLLEEHAFGTASGSTSARQPMRYKFRPVGYSSSADFYVYNSHYKASTDEASQVRRAYEAETIRADADALGQGKHIIYVGDYNIQSSSEDSYQILLSPGNGQAFDPIDSPGTWHNNFGFAPIHTQSPHDGSDDLSSGGMDDRLDFQLVTSELLDDEGLSYIDGSYHAFGNNGTTYNLPVNSVLNTYPLTQAQLDDLAHVSDHLPVVADYQLPARMQVTVAPVPQRVMINSVVSVAATVANTAPVVASNGADELDYTITTLGLLSGGGSGSVDALVAGDVYDLMLNTSVVGPRNGQVNASSNSQAVANGSYLKGVSSTILDHANASFASDSDLNTLTIDFGTLTTGGVISSEFDLFNLEQTALFTSALDLDMIARQGDTGVLVCNPALFSNLAAGDSRGFIASFNTGTAGSYSATYTLHLSDEDVPGEAGQILTLQLLGQVIEDLVGDLDNDGFVGLSDLDIILTNWNKAVPPGDPSADPTGDGFVGLDDLDIVLNHWNSGTPPHTPDYIPEPASIILLGSALTLYLRRH